MNKDIRSLLEACDEDGKYEFPSNFDGNDIEKRAREIFNAVSSKYNVQFEDWIHNQDASFGLAINFIEFQYQDSQAIYQPTLRFSNFGNLASMTMLESLPKELVELILDLLNKNGFNYIPSDELDCEYDGVMQGDTNLHTWWIRYFDWI